MFECLQFDLAASGHQVEIINQNTRASGCFPVVRL